MSRVYSDLNLPILIIVGGWESCGRDFVIKDIAPPNFAAKDFDITLPGKDDQKARIKDLKDSFKKDFYIDGLD
ncbi:hypothetical protein [Anaerococcus lactolyticus]|uniref:Uncharacterized protein n=1 Tax=Anaerococcus lactolyticus S7-1-13 TaxID=1284686 RepID=A0A095X610_9FIRM|nr:hypothetical protein [Anaerococcus lactolyticus]KGF05116.1 hypothetical protein HMPREF1630_01545 [Anaerococcus lactolyticus S7-1-13]